MSNNKVIPMLFNTEMVNALLEGRKTQTRRPIKFPVRYSHESGFSFMDKKEKWWACGAGFKYSDTVKNFVCPKAPWQIGDLIYVRETHHRSHTGVVTYRADSGIDPFSEDCGEDCSMFGEKWIPSIHMPRSASRITLKVTGVRVEQVQAITKEDATAEGFFDEPAAEGMDWKLGAKHNFKFTWSRTYKNWNENPWVWVIEFEVIKQNVNDYLEVAPWVFQSLSS